MKFILGTQNLLSVEKFINILINQRKRITILLTDVQKNSDKIQYTSMIKYSRT